MNPASDNMHLPDYRGGSIVNLMSSVIAACGGATELYPPLRALPPERLAGHRNLVLLVVDGLGHDHLVRAGAGGTLHALLRDRITSVFPSTTATAVTTFLTGVAPQQHALTGWHMYFRELGAVIAVLPFRTRHGAPLHAEHGIDANILFGHTPVFDRLPVDSYIVAPERIIHSEFNLAHVGRAHRREHVSLTHMFREIAHTLRARDARKYVYAYWPELDHLAHEHGIGSARAAAHLAEIDAGFDRFLEQIRGTDTAVIVTADHGFVDTTPAASIELDAHPALAETLLLPLCGERRVAYCYVQPGHERRFEDYVSTHLAGVAELYRSEHLIERGWFGLGAPHARLKERVGHYTLVMRDNATIKDWLPGERRYAQIGAHGGVTAAEMFVPLIFTTA